jgi:ribosomal protein L37E
MGKSKQMEKGVEVIAGNVVIIRCPKCGKPNYKDFPSDICHHCGYNAGRAYKKQLKK